MSDSSFAVVNYLTSDQQKTLHSLHSELKNIFVHRLLNSRDEIGIKVARVALTLLKTVQDANYIQLFIRPFLSADSTSYASLLSLKEMQMPKAGELLVKLATSWSQPYDKLVISNVIDLVSKVFQSPKKSETLPADIRPFLSGGEQQIQLWLKQSESSILLKKRVSRDPFMASSTIHEMEQQVRTLSPHHGFSQYFVVLQNKSIGILSEFTTLQLAKIIFLVVQGEIEFGNPRFDLSDLEAFFELAKTVKQKHGEEALFFLINAPEVLENKEAFNKWLQILGWIANLDDILLVLTPLSSFLQKTITLDLLFQTIESLSLKCLPKLEEQDENLEARFKRFQEDPSVMVSLKSDEIAELEEAYKKVKTYCAALKDLPMHLLVERGDVIRQKALLRKEPLGRDEILQLVAIGRVALFRYEGKYPYTTQVIVVMAILFKTNSCIAQMKTGEGKTIVDTHLMFVLAMQGRAVDFVTSSSSLAIRDQKRFKRFFEMFKITTSHICSTSQPPSDFNGQILYGAPTDFQFAWMRDLLDQKIRWPERLKNPFISRNFDALIIDEVDNLLVDTARNSARIAEPAPESYHWVYAPILKYVQTYRNALRLSDLRAFLIKELGETSKTKVNKLTEERLKSWVSSAEVALSKTEWVDYMIDKRKNHLGLFEQTVKIIDASNTGQVMEGMRWGHGIHEFVEVKHNISVQAESMTPLSMSHAVFYTFYKSIYGLTGTLGTVAERAEIFDIYHIDTFDVPPHLPSLRKDLQPLVVRHKKAQDNAIYSAVMDMRAQGRPVLILCPSIKYVRALAEFLKKREVSPLTVLDATESAEREEAIIAEAGEARKVTLATNMAGRGTDIILSQESLKAGGLHVILTFYPESKRVEDQAIGRAGRQGQPGSSQMILCSEDFQTSGMPQAMEILLQLIEGDPLVFLSKWREVQIARRKEQHERRAFLERTCFKGIELLFEKIQTWETLVRDDAFLLPIAQKLSKIKIIKAPSREGKNLSEEEILLFDELISLLTKFQQPLTWSIYLTKVIDRVKTMIKREWAMSVYVQLENLIAQGQQPGEDIKKIQTQIEEIFTLNFNRWKGQLEATEECLLGYLRRLTGIAFGTKQ